MFDDGNSVGGGVNFFLGASRHAGPSAPTLVHGANGLATKNKIERGRDAVVVIKQMPTKINLQWTASAEMWVSTKIAKKLKGVALSHYDHSDDKVPEPWSWFVKWDKLYYYDDDGKLQEGGFGEIDIEIDDEKWPDADLDDECYTSDEEEEEKEED